MKDNPVKKAAVSATKSSKPKYVGSIKQKITRIDKPAKQQYIGSIERKVSVVSRKVDPLSNANKSERLKGRLR